MGRRTNAPTSSMARPNASESLAHRCAINERAESTTHLTPRRSQPRLAPLLARCAREEWAAKRLRAERSHAWRLCLACLC
jgi:hypothetical protein